MKAGETAIGKAEYRNPRDLESYYIPTFTARKGLALVSHVLKFSTPHVVQASGQRA